VDEKNINKSKNIWPKILRGSLILLLFALVAAVFLHNATALYQDLGRHLKTGEIIWQTKSVPTTNLYSYAEPNFSFINHHWLSEVIYYGLYNIIGIKGLIIFNTLLVLATFAIIFLLVYRKKFFITAILGGLLCLGLLSERVDIRPEVFGWLILALFLYILEKNRQRINWSFWLLLPLQLFWVNLHISFIFGPVIFFFFFLDRLWVRRRELFQLDRRKAFIRHVIFLAVSGLALGAVCLVNPNTWRGLLYPLVIFKNYGYSIAENQSPFFLETLMDNPTIVFFKITVILLVLSFIINIRRFRLFYFLTGLLFVVLSWRAIRNFPLLGLAIWPILAVNFSQARQDYDKYFVRWGRSLWRVFLRLLTLAAIFVILIGGVYLFVTNKYYLQANRNEKFGLIVPPGAAKAVDFLKEQNITGRMFNNFDIGGYLIWRLYPQQKIFVDGRPEAYPADFFQRVYIPMQQDEAVWNKYSQEYGLDYVFFLHTDQTPWGRRFLEIMPIRSGWTMVYLDGAVAIWVRDIPGYASLIKQHALTGDKLTVQAQDLLVSQDIKELNQLGLFFQTIGRDDLAILFFEKSLEKYAGSKEVLYNLGILYAENKETGNQAIEYFQKALRLDKKFIAAELALGKIYYQVGNFSEARAAWQRALMIEKNNQEARLLLDNMGLIPFTK